MRREDNNKKKQKTTANHLAYGILILIYILFGKTKLGNKNLKDNKIPFQILGHGSLKFVDIGLDPKIQCMINEMTFCF